MITFESRDIRGTENLHLSRVVYYGNGGMSCEMRLERVKEILQSELKRSDFSVMQSYDGKKDVLVVPKGIKALKELRDKVFTITEKM